MRYLLILTPGYLTRYART